MNIVFNDGHQSTLIVDDAVAGLKQIPDNSVHVAVTSPPYFQLRRYFDGVKFRDDVPDDIRDAVIKELESLGIHPTSK